jgi:hypothetical protein
LSGAIITGSSIDRWVIGLQRTLEEMIKFNLPSLDGRFMACVGFTLYASEASGTLKVYD